MTGKFVTIEGIEGSGKSVQVELLCQELTRRKVPFLATKQPGGTSFGEELRRILLSRNGSRREPMSELLLYLSDRFQHLREVIEPALAAGRLVISDRYHDATLAYQGYARGIGLEVIEDLSRPLGLRVPDLTLLLDLDVEVGLGRACERNRVQGQEEWGRFEAEDLDFHNKVREGYRLIASREPGRVLLIDASDSPQEVLAALLAAIEEKQILTP